MNKVQRYIVRSGEDYVGEIDPYAQGDLVKFVEYENLHSQLEECRKEKELLNFSLEKLNEVSNLAINDRKRMQSQLTLALELLNHVKNGLNHIDIKMLEKGISQLKGE